MDLYVQSEIGVCNEFVKGSKKEQVSIVISPLRVEGAKEDQLRIIMGCNMWRACLNKACYFSLAARQLSGKEKPGTQVPG